MLWGHKESCWLPQGNASFLLVFHFPCAVPIGVRVPHFFANTLWYFSLTQTCPQPL